MEIGRAWNRFDICSEKQQRTETAKRQTTPKFFRGSKLSPSYMDKKTQCQRGGSEVCMTVFLFHNSKIRNPLPRWN